jgi:hypothetical protein
MQSSTIITYCSHTVHKIRCCTTFWIFFICYKIQHRYYTRFKYLLILSKLYSNSLSFPLLLYGTGTILSSVREITQIKIYQNHIILESSQKLANVLLDQSDQQFHLIHLFCVAVIKFLWGEMKFINKFIII